MVADISLILLICFSSFRGLALSGEQGQFSCQPHGHNADLSENIHKLIVCGAVSGFSLGLIHFIFTSSEGAVVVLLFPLPTGDVQSSLTKVKREKSKNLQPVMSRLERVH
jgi:hypothetical protein